ncbi:MULTISPECIES: N-6 DNA methylase [Pseudoalteromonas]|uniref:N-6 DNA methylase n=1 Tax=Pseudoalteromonas TaxID=53246 RepID=UPI000C421ED0|nr:MULTISPECIES: N-6 DNA methylase [Pseudoalteromonas]MAY60491.1 restriction endonuclease [Pseudoalteromonas sp.]MDN3409605.1 N-6 DNA methylase [Pseudoalteromonas sp. APC 3894]MDN3416891.1 N-6 DNA methylase [Pseudoalteromonas sp. APC 3227]MDN3421696.1 N-6 DNA methylase [Pseudoalteromonas sp. APC 3895]MDN3424389.1 N-6 DNA methylase [Pseudoalteromonas sp. APC 3896]
MKVKTLEYKKLEKIEVLLAELCGSNHEYRLQLLEAVSSLIGGFNLEEYLIKFNVEVLICCKQLVDEAKQVLNLIKLTDIPVNLALSCLSHEPLDEVDKRSAGSYYTDSRLATYLAKISHLDISKDSKIIDPASGNGMLLAALVSKIFEDNPDTGVYLLENNIVACDISAIAQRACRVVLSSFLTNVPSIEKMVSNWLCVDSLLVSEKDWKRLSPEGFDLVLANPPWEKLKLTKYEYLKEKGQNNHYGSEVTGFCDVGLSNAKKELAEYSKKIATKYPDTKGGEIDLYMPFLELFHKLAKLNGRVSCLVPAGLIRSQGTELLRRRYFEFSESVKITIFDNKPKFFSIDTRFKFLAVTVKPKCKPNPDNLISVSYGSADGRMINYTSNVLIKLEELKQCRADLTLPEVSTTEEWEIFKKINTNGLDWSSPESSWYPNIQREVDMTNKRKDFIKESASTLLPIIEGRMVSNLRFGAKSYISGSGRSAIWRTNKHGSANISPQFYIAPKSLAKSTLERTQVERAGFCDIAGQTNERGMMSAIVPSSVVAGNKVPTVLFDNSKNPDLIYAWVGMTNSFVFDWAIRRIISTTVNLFLLKSIKLPAIEESSNDFITLVKSVKSIINSDLNEKCSMWEVAELRATIDIIVFIKYGLAFTDLDTILDDFPLLDRGQPCIAGETTSTITKDFLTLRVSQYLNQPYEKYEKRVILAKENGAVPYINGELAKMTS